MRRHLPALAPLLLLACTEPPVVTAVDPAQGLPGSTLTVTVDHLPDGAGLALDASSGAQPVALAITGRTADQLTATVPDDLAPGTYDLLVQGTAHVVRLDGAFVVEAPPRDLACDHPYRANTSVNLATDQVTLDRFHDDGRRETVQVDLGDIDKVAYEQTPHAKGTCHAVYLLRKEGPRLRFMDDVEVDLRPRAERLAKEIGRPLVVTTPPPAPAPAGEASTDGAAETDAP